MRDTDIEEQVRKLLSGEVSTVVTMISEAEKPGGDAQSRAIVTPSAMSPARAGDDLTVAEQQALVLRLRAAAARRQQVEASSEKRSREEQLQFEKSYDSLLAEADRLTKATDVHLAYATRSLDQIQMQVPAAAPVTALQGDQVVTLAVLEQLAEQSATARARLTHGLEEYANWWLKRFFRLLVLAGIVVVGILILRKIGAALLGGIIRLYSKIHEALGRLEPEWLPKVLWPAILVLSLALALGAAYYGARWVYRRYFDTQDKRGAVQQQLALGRTELVRRVFASDENEGTKYFWGRMVVMVRFAIRQKISA